MSGRFSRFLIFSFLFVADVFIFIFRSKNKTSNSPSILSKDIIISGKIESEGDVILFGKVTGEIRCNRLFVSKEATFDEKSTFAELFNFYDE